MSLATLTSLHRGLHEWATRAGNQKFLCDEQEAQLRRVLRDPTRRTQANVAAWMLGSWHLGNGMLRVLNGESEGFDEARQGQTLRRTALLARNSQYTGPRRGNKSRLPFSLLHGAWTSLLGLALHDPGAEPLYEFMMSLPDIAFSEKDSVAFFTRDLLDWHLSEARSAGKSYDDPACRVFPVEIIAIQHVRQWVDLPMPRVDHPLMHTNLATMKPSLSWPQHELAAALERQLRSG